MGRKVFVSYKHSDNNVEFLRDFGSTARAYVDYLIEHRLHDEIYKGEGDEDISHFRDDTIKTHLKTKIHDSSITIVLISPGMKNPHQMEADQWIPWEVSYSLKEITRSDKLSHTNGILAIVLPDQYGSYDYYITQPCSVCKTRQFGVKKLFQILQDNMFNSKDKSEIQGHCPSCNSTFYRGGHSYIESVKWLDFLSNKDHYLDRAANIRDDRKSYNIVKEVKNGW
ncbi:MAG: TIR domain-containing protein [Oceanospirillaceae bacterium]|nr:TIR domain-containing protein [Oceanospirillaceae bacterium]